MDPAWLVEEDKSSNWNILWRYLRGQLPSMKHHVRLPEPKRKHRLGPFEKWVFPAIKNMPNSDLGLIRVQPMDEPRIPLNVVKPNYWRRAKSFLRFRLFRICRKVKAAAEFARFLYNRKQGDEFWYYNNDCFMCLAGRAGYALVRDGEVYISYMTTMN